MAAPIESVLEQEIQNLVVEPGSAVCVWLGQGGYLFKSSAGVTVMLDPYFSDWAEQIWGVQRILDPVIDHTRFAPALLLSIHWHEDHLDKPVIEHYARNENVRFVGSESSAVRAEAWGWDPGRVTRLAPGESMEFRDVRIEATFARHESPTARADDATGFLLDIGGVRFWDVADSEYDARLLSMREAKIDVAFVPINGVGGNMNAHEAALLMWQVQPRIAIPMHYDMWTPEGYGPGATLDPELFRDTLARLGGGPEYRTLETGVMTRFFAPEST